MSRRPGVPSGFSRLDMVRSMAVMAAVVILVGAALERRPEVWRHPAPGAAETLQEPVAAEANVFHVRAGELAVAPDLAGDRRGHVRSLDIYRRLRAYPGAPRASPMG